MDKNSCYENEKVNNTEKITVNMNVVDLGQIDLMVEQGFYSNRTDFIKTAIRNQLSTHSEEIKSTIKKMEYSLGIVMYRKRDLEEYLEKGTMVDIIVVGMIFFEKDIPRDLALKTIKSIKVFGSLKISDELKEALKDRIK